MQYVEYALTLRQMYYADSRETLKENKGEKRGEKIGGHDCSYLVSNFVK